MEKIIESGVDIRLKSAVTISGLNVNVGNPKSGVFVGRDVSNVGSKFNEEPQSAKRLLPPIGTSLPPTIAQQNSHVGSNPCTVFGVEPSHNFGLSQTNVINPASTNKFISPISSSTSSISTTVGPDLWNTKQAQQRESKTTIPATTTSVAFCEDTRAKSDDFNWRLTTMEFGFQQTPDHSDSSPWDSDETSFPTIKNKLSETVEIAHRKHEVNNFGFGDISDKTDDGRQVSFLDPNSNDSENNTLYHDNDSSKLKLDNRKKPVDTIDSDIHSIHTLSWKPISNAIDFGHVSNYPTIDDGDAQKDTATSIEQHVYSKPTKHKKKKKHKVLQLEEKNDEAAVHVSTALSVHEFKPSKRKKKKKHTFVQPDGNNIAEFDVNDDKDHTSKIHGRHRETNTLPTEEESHGTVHNNTSVLFVQEAHHNKRKKRKSHRSRNTQEDSEISTSAKHMDDEGGYAQATKERKHRKKNSKHRDRQEEYSGIEGNISSFDKEWSTVESENPWSNDNNYTMYM